MKLLEKHVGKLIIAVMILQGTLMFSLFRDLSGRLHESMVATAVDNAKATIHRYKQLRHYYSHNVVAKVDESSGLRVSYDHQIDDNTIPLPASMIHDLSGMMQEDEGGVTH